MKVIFARSHRLIPILIRVVTWSRWHHCAAITKDGKYVIESRGKVGVIKTPINEFKSRYKSWAIAELDCDEDRAFSFLNSQLGKEYDLKAIFGILFRTGWDRQQQWFCSELIAAASDRFRKESISRVTPEHIWMISK